MDSVSKSPDLMGALQGDMNYRAQRQQTLARNIANIDTPGFKASDVQEPDFERLVMQTSGSLGLNKTSPKHLDGMRGMGNGPFRVEPMQDPREISPNQNNVVLEDQMARIAGNNAQYEISSLLYKKFTMLYRSALGQR